MGYVATHLAEPGTALSSSSAASCSTPASRPCPSFRTAITAREPPDAVYFTKDHEWIRVDGDTATVGISNHAQEQLGDIVFAEVPDAGRR